MNYESVDGRHVSQSNCTTNDKIPIVTAYRQLLLQRMKNMGPTHKLSRDPKSSNSPASNVVMAFSSSRPENGRR